MRTKNETITDREPKRVLGRGLSALIPAAVTPPPTNVPASEVFDESSSSTGLRYIPLLKIALNPYQPREDFSAEQLSELSDSIRQHGVLQPIVVRPKGKETYELVAGERRFRAATNAGLSEIPAIVKEIDDRSSLAIALIENIQRQELNPVESARAYQRLLNEFHLTQTELAQEVGKSQPSIANALRLLQLPEQVLESLSAGKITEGHAKAILSLENTQDKISLWQTVIKDGLNVRETERRAAAVKNPVIPRGINVAPAMIAPSSVEIRHIEQELSLSLGTKVKIRDTGNGKGSIEIQFYGEEQLEGLLQRLKNSDPANI